MSELEDDAQAQDGSAAAQEGAELSPEQLEAVQGGTNALRLLGQILSNVSKTRSEISQTFARNARA